MFLWACRFFECYHVSNTEPAGMETTGPGLIADLEQMRYHETETDAASAAPARAGSALRSHPCLAVSSAQGKVDGCS
jgi:hypothetical protein